MQKKLKLILLILTTLPFLVLMLLTDSFIIVFIYAILLLFILLLSRKISKENKDAIKYIIKVNTIGLLFFFGLQFFAGYNDKPFKGILWILNSLYQVNAYSKWDQTYGILIVLIPIFFLLYSYYLYIKTISNKKQLNDWLLFLVFAATLHLSLYFFIYYPSLKKYTIQNENWYLLHQNDTEIVSVVAQIDYVLKPIDSIHTSEDLLQKLQKTFGRFSTKVNNIESLPFSSTVISDLKRIQTLRKLNLELTHEYEDLKEGFYTNQKTQLDLSPHNCDHYHKKKSEKNTQSTIIDRKTTVQNIVNRLNCINESLQWEKLKCGLYINKNKEIALQIPFATELGPTVNYISHIEYSEKKKLLNDIVDTLSFKYLGSTFYKDKNHIYHYYDMAYGGHFYIYDIADHTSFKVIGDHYAKDKNHIYGERAGILEGVDYKTFTSQKGAGPYAKDKHGYYFWDDLTITHQELQKKYQKSNLSVREFSRWNKN